MDNNKNSTLKEEIVNKVQSAIDSKDFANLNNDITASVNRALEELRYQLRYKPVDGQPSDKASSRIDVSQQSATAYDNAAPHSNVHIGFMSSQTLAYKPPTGKTSSVPVKRTTSATPATTSGKQTPSVFIPHKPVGKIKGSFYYALGLTATALTSVGTLALAAVSSALPGVTALSATAGALVLSLPLWLILTWRGSSIRKRYTRFQMYLSRLRTKGYASISELARSVGRSEQYVIRDLQKMLSDGMFLEGHFDEKYTCFIANNTSWQQYISAQDGYYNRVNSSASAAKPQDTVIDESKKQNDRVNAVIKQGTEYINKIHQINDDLPDEEISAKLDTLETTIVKIFQHIDEHPEQLPELDKFMQYYMPTTIKLITVYRDFDIQPIQGENINTAKKEILGTLDTINHAFIKLFDSLFQATAWDVSADISVLETMLAREGLTKSAFETKGEQ